jgi:dolichol-phosphate mannosyltransferase
MELHKTAIKLSIVVSVYNEEQTIELLYNELKKVLNEMVINHEIVFVNDGSVDNSLSIMRNIASKDSNVRIINFSRNFGHEAAMLAGIDNSKGDIIICMDADLQHPPSLLPHMLEKYCEGNDIVLTKRLKNQGVKKGRKILTSFYYYILNNISQLEIEPNVSDFFLISREVAIILKNQFRENIRFLRGLILIMGFKKTYLEFVAPKRSAGKSKYSILKLFRLSFSSIAAFSNIPLYFGIIIGLTTSLFSFLVITYSIIMKFLGHTPPGYTTIVVLVSFLFSVVFLLIGILGYYIGIILTEVKKRPIYIIKSIEEQKCLETKKDAT